MSTQTEKGFTLVELLLYVSIIGVILVSFSVLLSIVMQSRIKNQTVSEVEQQGSEVLQSMTQIIRNTDNITSPTIGTTGASLTLDVLDAAKDPTIFDLAAGVIRIKEGAGAAVPLTNSRVTASSLTFKNLSRTGTPGTIRIQFTLSHINSGGRNEYAFTKTFYGSASLR